MIEGQSAVWLNTLTISILAFFIASLIVSIIASLFAQKLLNIEVSSRKSLLWLLVLMPWLTGAGVAFFFLDIHVFSNIVMVEAVYTHWHHMDVFTWASWHGASLVVTLIFCITLLVIKVIQLKFHCNEVANLTSFSKSLNEGVFEVELLESNAFTTGFFNKKCFITSGMLQKMNKQEMSVIMAHEKAHARMNDPLKKWLFGIFTAFFVPSLAARLKLHMTLAMEQTADRTVVNGGFASVFVANTLLKVTRLNILYSSVKSCDLTANFGTDVLEQRIHYLLGLSELKPSNKVVMAIFVILTLGVCLFSIDGLHHLIEKILVH